MLKSIQNAFTSLKEKSVGTALKAFLNKQFQHLGNVTELEINPRDKTIHLEVELKGETAPITITAGSYTLSQENGRTYIVLNNLTASREWITGLLSEFVAGRKFALPNAAKLAL